MNQMQCQYMMTSYIDVDYRPSLETQKITKYNKFETKSIQNLILDRERMNVVCKFKKK